MRYSIAIYLVVCGSIVNSAAAVEEARIATEGNRWILETKTVERIVAFEDGKLLTKSFKDKATGKELIADGAASEEFFLCLGDSKQPITGATGGWKLISAKQTKLKQGELQLDLTLQRESLVITKSYIVYPASSIVRQWLTIKNAGETPLLIADPGFLCETVRPGDPEKLDFHWMTGGDNQPGSWLLKTEKLAARRSRARSIPTIRFPAPLPTCPGDGINAKVSAQRKTSVAGRWLAARRERNSSDGAGRFRGGRGCRR